MKIFNTRHVAKTVSQRNWTQQKRFISEKPFYFRVESTLRKGGFLGSQESYTDFLRRNKIISQDETPERMFNRVAHSLAEAGQSFYGVKQMQYFFEIFLNQLKQFKIILSTPLYTNAGRHAEKSLSACAVPPINFKKIESEKLKALVSSYHVKGMGTGFNFDTAEDPVAMLELLNQFAISEVHQGLIERPVGNMGILSVDHPRVLEFAAAKSISAIKEWKFNISINLTHSFMEALKTRTYYRTLDDRVIDPANFLHEIAKYARETGDPGVVFMHKHAASNKTPHLGEYVSVAPCSEVPLFNGEVCQFAYINLHSFIQQHRINYIDLKNTVHHTVTLLDNALELSLQNLPTQESKEIVSRIRKIGIGICGFSDVLIALGFPYDSPQTKRLAENILSFINFESKVASVNLAKQRGPFPAFHEKQTRRELIIDPFLNKETDSIRH